MPATDCPEFSGSWGGNMNQVFHCLAVEVEVAAETFAPSASSLSGRRGLSSRLSKRVVVMNAGEASLSLNHPLTANSFQIIFLQYSESLYIVVSKSNLAVTRGRGAKAASSNGLPLSGSSLFARPSGLRKFTRKILVVGCRARRRECHSFCNRCSPTYGER